MSYSCLWLPGLPNHDLQKHEASQTEVPRLAGQPACTLTQLSCLSFPVRFMEFLRFLSYQSSGTKKPTPATPNVPFSRPQGLLISITVQRGLSLPEMEAVPGFADTATHHSQDRHHNCTCHPELDGYNLPAEFCHHP